MTACVFHGTDMDGWTSASIVEKYLLSQKITNVNFIPYNYSNELSVVESLNVYVENELSHHREPVIYMVDCTLSFPYMSRYAPWLVHIDHHKSVIEDPEYQALKHTFKQCFSTIKGIVQGYTDPVQISASELTWNALFKEKPMPLFVFLTGRYDVWDKKNPGTDEFNAFTRNPGKQFPISRRTYLFKEEWFSKLYDDTFVIEKCLPRGRQILEFQKESWALEAQTAASWYDHPSGYQISVVNRGGINSSYFDSLYEKHPRIGIACTYAHRIRNASVSISFFTVNGNNTLPAMNVMEEFMKTIPNHLQISKGGHLHACGCVIKDNALAYFRTWLEKNHKRTK